jgi:hypothetical protein
MQRMFQQLDGMYLRNQKNSTFLEGANIFRDKFIEQLIDELNRAIFSMLTRYKSGAKINEEEISFVIQHIGFCGLLNPMSYMSINLSKLSKTEVPVFCVEEGLPYETSYFKEKFIDSLIQYVEN